MNKIIHRECKDCGKPFEITIGKGTTGKVYCDDEKCRADRRKRQSVEKLKTYAECECGRPANRVSAGLCEACYCCFRRRGTTRRHVVKYRHIKSHGYVMLSGQYRHPLANRNGHVYEHRKVLYDAVGAGQHECHWCGVPVTWDDMDVDHLNGDKQDNRRDNLVTSCHPCNTLRSYAVRFIERLRPERQADWHNTRHIKGQIF